jgi:hypothetical protein
VVLGTGGTFESFEGAPVGPQSLSIGAAGEALANTLLLGFFEYVARPQPDTRGVDFIAGGLIGYDAGPDFHFQVKSGRTYREAGGFSISSAVLDHWLSACETTPIFLLFVERLGFGRERYLYLAFHDWLLGHIDSWHSGASPVTIRLADFTLLRSAEVFRSALETEAARAQARAGSVWSTSRICRQYVSDEAFFLKHIDSVPYFEVPVVVLQQILDDNRLIDYTRVRSLVRGLWQDQTAWSPDFRRWVDDVRSVIALVPNPAESQKRQFSRFRQQVWNFTHGRDVTLPLLRVRNVISWRAFVTMYPESFGIVEHALSTFQRRSVGEIRFALSLASMVANCGMEPLVTRSQRLITSIEPHVLSILVNDFDSYILKREYYRCRCEAAIDLPSSETTLLAVMSNRTALRGKWERRHLATYGWGDRSSILRNIDRKLTMPKARDVNSMRYYEMLRTVL